MPGCDSTDSLNSATKGSRESRESRSGLCRAEARMVLGRRKMSVDEKGARL